MRAHVIAASFTLVCCLVITSFGAAARGSDGTNPPQSEPIATGSTTTDLKSELALETARLDVETARQASYQKQIDSQRGDATWLGEIDKRRNDDRDFIYKVVLTIAAILILMWLLPQVSSISLPFGTGVLSIQKLPAPPAPPPPPPPILGGAALGILPFAPAPPSSAAAALGYRTGQDALKEKESEFSLYRQAGVAPDTIFLTHRIIGSAREPTVEVRLDGDSEEVLDRTTRVSYAVPNTISAVPLSSSDRTQHFAVRFTGTAEFMIYAFVYFLGVESPVRLKRYINIGGSRT
jgi:hypothetical protein